MLNEKQSSNSLLGKKQSVSKSDVAINSDVMDQKLNSKKKKSKKSQSQFTSVLKVFNLIIGFCVVSFGVLCYYFFNTEKDGEGIDFLGLILPGYIAASGLLILLIECNIGFIARNMKFLYNFFGRGLFNIYVGVMPLSMIKTNDKSQTLGFQVIVYVMVSLMCLIGLMYIFSKIFCCAQEENKKKKNKKKYDSQDSSDSD